MLVILLSILILTACQRNSGNSQPPTPTTTQNPPTASSAKEPTSNWDNWLATNKPKDYEITQILQGDIDGDGFTEIVVSFGSKNGAVYSTTFLIRKRDSNYQNIGELKANVASVFSLKIVRLDSSNQSYIFASQTNGGQGVGYVVYGLKNDEIVVVDKEFPATGKGYYTLVPNNTGLYARVDTRDYQDQQHHQLTIHYQWNGSQFRETSREIRYSLTKDNKFVHPSKPEDVIKCYLEAVYLGLDSEVKELIMNEAVRKFEVLNYFGENGGFAYGLSLAHQTVTRDGTSVLIKTTDQRSKTSAYFHLAFVQEKWKVSAISTSK